MPQKVRTTSDIMSRIFSQIRIEKYNGLMRLSTTLETSTSLSSSISLRSVSSFESFFVFKTENLSHVLFQVRIILLLWDLSKREASSRKSSKPPAPPEKLAILFCLMYHILVCCNLKSLSYLLAMKWSCMLSVDPLVENFVPNVFWKSVRGFLIFNYLNRLLDLALLCLDRLLDYSNSIT